MAIITSTTFPMFSNPEFKKIMSEVDLVFGDNDALSGASVFNEFSLPMDKPSWVSRQFYGLRAGAFVQEGSDPTPQLPNAGHQRSRAVAQYGSCVKITQLTTVVAPEVVKLIPQMLNNSFLQTIALQQQFFYDYSIKGATVPTYGGRNLADVFAIDSVAYFSDAHYWRGDSATTFSNIQSAVLGLDTNGVEEMVNQGMGWRDPRGMPMQRHSKGIVVGDSLIGRANVLFKSEKQPGTANNDLNLNKYVNYGKGVGDIKHWALMGTDEWLMEFELPAGQNAKGLTTAFWNGRNKRKDYFDTPSEQSRTFEYRTYTLTYGDDWTQYITNRIAIT